MTLKTLLLSDGTRVAFRAAGQGAPVVLLHGVGMQSAAWVPQIEALAGDYSVFTLDLPGHGGSGPLSEGAALPDYVAWAACVLEALGVETTAVAGHSMGALIALGLCIEHSVRISRATLLNCVHRRSPAARAAVLDRAREIQRDKGDATATLDRWFGTDQGAVRASVAGWLAEVPHEGYAAAYKVFSESDAIYADRLGEISCPVMFLTGDGDPNSTPEMSRTMAGQAPQGKAVIIPGHRHMVNLTAPDQVNAALLDWLSGKEKAA